MDLWSVWSERMRRNDCIHYNFCNAECTDCKSYQKDVSIGGRQEFNYIMDRIEKENKMENKKFLLEMLKELNCGLEIQSSALLSTLRDNVAAQLMIEEKECNYKCHDCKYMIGITDIHEHVNGICNGPNKWEPKKEEQKNCRDCNYHCGGICCTGPIICKDKSHWVKRKPEYCENCKLYYAKHLITDKNIEDAPLWVCDCCHTRFLHSQENNCTTCEMRIDSNCTSEVSCYECNQLSPKIQPKRLTEKPCSECLYNSDGGCVSLVLCKDYNQKKLKTCHTCKHVAKPGKANNKYCDGCNYQTFSLWEEKERYENCLSCKHSGDYPCSRCHVLSQWEPKT